MFPFLKHKIRPVQYLTWFLVRSTAASLAFICRISPTSINNTWKSVKYLNHSVFILQKQNTSQDVFEFLGHSTASAWDYLPLVSNPWISVNIWKALQPFKIRAIRRKTLYKITRNNGFDSYSTLSKIILCASKRSAEPRLKTTLTVQAHL